MTGLEAGDAQGDLVTKAVNALRAEAHRERRAGHQGAAIALLEKALAEPVDLDSRGELLLELASAEARLNALHGADRYLEALAVVDEPPRRVRAAIRRARCLVGAGLVADALDQIDAVRAEVDDAELVLEADLAYVTLARHSLDTRPLGRARLARIAPRPVLDDADIPLQLLGELAYELALAGDDHRRVIDAATAALGGAELAGLHELSPFTRHASLLALVWAGDLDTVDRAAQLGLARARRRGIVVDAAAAHELLANVYVRRGDPAAAIAHADVAISAARDGVASLLPAAVGIKAMMLATQGHVDEALAALALPGDERKWSSLATFHGYLIGAAVTHLAAGDFRQAHRLALRCGTLATSMGTENPAVLPWRELAAHAAAAMGMSAEADDLAADAVERARSFGAPAPIAVALRALAAARPAQARDLLDEATTFAAGEQLTAAAIDLDLAELRRAASRRPAGPATHAHLKVLGGYSVIAPAGTDVTPRGIAGKAIRVLAAADAPLHVEQLADALWDDGAAPDRSRARLRNVIARTRVGSDPMIVRDGDVVRLDPQLTIDAVQFEDACRRALAASEEDALETAIAATLTYGGDLLPTDPYAEWATLPRERLRLRYLAMCDRAARLATSAGLDDVAVDRLQAAIRHDPYDTDRYVLAATILHRSGDAAGADAMRERERRVRQTFSP